MFRFTSNFCFVVAPSQELVRRIRELYQRRVPDVRFLIPVLSGLTKVSELICSIQ